MLCGGILLTSLLYAAVRADELDNLEEGSGAESVASSIALPEFTPAASVNAEFVEQFVYADVESSRWTPSQAIKDKGEDDQEEFSFTGQWALEEPHVFKGMNGQKGLVVKDAAKHHAISTQFDQTLDNKDKQLVVQYEVKLQNGLECGGAYLKLLTKSPDGIHAAEYSDKTPYTVMFGPDKCGGTNKVHFIVRHKNPITGEYQEKHLKMPPSALITKTSALYTLIINPDQTYEIRINGETKKAGSMHEDFNPAFAPPKEISDPDDKKPEDWVDDAKISDPEAEKPDDWDEDAPFEIEDKDAVKPADWLDDEPLTIPDPEAEKPDDWDDEEDGDWIPPTITNPKCSEVSGCGMWKQPMMRNPEFKGKWIAPKIDNPEYKGPWKPRNIPNPDYYEVESPADLEPMDGIGFELWTMQNDILFDNIFIGHSLEAAEQFGNETWSIKIKAEREAEEAAKPKRSDNSNDFESAMDTSFEAFKANPIKFVRIHVLEFIKLVKIDPLQAIKSKPETFVAISTTLVTLVAIAAGFLGILASPSSNPEIKKATENSTKESKKTEETTEETTKNSNGADEADGEVKVRRSTRRTD